MGKFEESGRRKNMIDMCPNKCSMKIWLKKQKGWKYTKKGKKTEYRNFDGKM